MSVDPIVREICGVLDEYYQTDAVKEAIDLLEPLYEKNLTSVILATFLRIAYYDNKQWEEVIHCLEYVINNESFDIFNRDRVYFWIGYAYSQLKDHDKAISNFKESISIYPGYALAHNNLGYEYYLNKQYNEAIECYKNSIELNPNDTYAPNNLVYAYFYANRLEELKEYLANPPRKLRKASLDAAEKALNSSK